MIDNSSLGLRGQEPNLILIRDYMGGEIQMDHGQQDEELIYVCDILNEIIDIDGDIRYYLCDIQSKYNNNNNNKFDISNETLCLNITKQFINILQSDYKQKKAT
eukprot:532555_1